MDKIFIQGPPARHPDLGRWPRKRRQRGRRGKSQRPWTIFGRDHKHFGEASLGGKFRAERAQSELYSGVKRSCCAGGCCLEDPGATCECLFEMISLPGGGFGQHWHTYDSEAISLGFCFGRYCSKRELRDKYLKSEPEFLFFSRAKFTRKGRSW